MAGAAACSAAGTLSASALLTALAAATFPVAGLLAVEGIHTPEGAAAFPVAGFLTTLAAQDHVTNPVAFPAAGFFVVEGLHAPEGAAAFPAAGFFTVEADVSGTMQGTAAFPAAGLLTVEAIETMLGAAAFPAAGLLTVEALHAPEGAAAFLAEGFLVTLVVQDHVTNPAAFPAEGFLVAEALHAPEGAAALLAEGLFVAEAVETMLGAATFPVEGLLVIEAIHTPEATAAFLAEGFLAATVLLVAATAVAFPAEGFLDARYAPEGTGAAFPAEAILRVEVLHAPEGAAALIAEALLIVEQSVVVRSAVAELSATGALMAEGLRSLPATIDLVGAGLLAVESATNAITVALTAEASLVAQTILLRRLVLGREFTRRYVWPLRYVLSVTPELGFYVVVVEESMGQMRLVSMPSIGPSQEQTMGVDFGEVLPAGVTLTGTPLVTVTVSSGDDTSPSSRLLRAGIVGTAPKAIGGSGVVNAAVLFQVGTCVVDTIYVVDVVCDRTDADVAEASTRFTCLAPE